MGNSKSKKNSKVSSIVKFIIVVSLIGLYSYTGAVGFKSIFGYKVAPFTETIKKGLDLQGGVSVLEEIQADEVDEATMERTIEMLSMRVNPDGVKETSVQQEGENRIRIEIPGEFDAEKVLESIGKTGKLEFRDPDGNVILSGDEVTDASAYLDQYSSPTISLEFSAEGTTKFAEATEKFIGQAIGIYMDDELLTNPTVNSTITDGKAIITGSDTLEEASRKAGIIKSGALPVTLKAVEYKTVGATLGASALPLSIKAGIIGILIVFIFMIAYYRMPGLMANIALLLYVFLVLGTFSTIEATLTLSGIAGFLLTVGMAVDANVLIFERIKEELKLGKTIKNAVDTGFSRALSSILDSNITTIIAAIVLYSLGSGSVKGFALTLMIGIVLSIFTALTITRLLLNLAINIGLIKSSSHFGVRRG
ncbi:protein translocase subunit SecD [Clostridium grantii]|uniref:Protein translocase subunit SecD n=1 Tax=Clostridium grantii DSM 8605 TaxID=1121316 RepID=A0A1M5SJJ0_9CLOT|nr:protein translocase subunit SecD [Clostridium grantii]SHH38706.1 preprotein translocase subunit SecD [Clostridium grantii DSM 8605]